MPSSKQQTLAAPAVPTFPDPEGEYTGQSQRSTNGLLRTFMQRLTGALQALFGPAGGQYIDNPNGLFFNTGEQMFALADTAYPVTFNATYLSNLIALQSGSTSRIEAATAGIYNFQFTGQVLSENSSAKDIFLWIRRNGTDIPYSTRSTTIDTNNHTMPLTWSFNIDMQLGDYIELVASVTDTDLHLHAEAASAPHTGIPSGVMTVNYMSAMPATAPVLPS